MALENVMEEIIPIYNNYRPQGRLGRNTPNKLLRTLPINFSKYSNGFKTQKDLRVVQNKRNSCHSCL